MSVRCRRKNRGRRQWPQVYRAATGNAGGNILRIFWNMSEVTLENVLALNDELAAFAEIGIPSNLAPGASPAALPGTLQQINSSLTLRSDLGQSLITATSENQELPPIYRSALEAGLRSGRLTATLDGVSRQATADNDLRSTLGQSLVPPLIVLGLGYLGFIVLCLNFSPTVEGMYAQFSQTPGRLTRLLVTMRAWLPYWATLLPLLILGAVVLWRRGWGSWQRLVPGARHYAAAVRNANFAHQLTSLVENGVSLEESLPLAAAVTGDSRLIIASKELSAAHAEENLAAADPDALRALPPLLRWALTGNLGQQSLPDVLRFAEKTYRQQADRRATTWRSVLPATIGALLGGVVVLAYGLSMFGPFVELLRDVAY